MYKSAILVLKFRFFSIFSVFFSHIHSDFVSDQSGRSEITDVCFK